MNFFIIAILYFADDGLMLSNTIEEAENNIRLIQEIAQSLGLLINKDKSNILIYNLKEKPRAIENIEVCDTIKYLGVKISNTRNCFARHKEETINKAKQLANMTYSIISRSCNRLMIGKNYWKSMCLSIILYAAEVIEYTEEEIAKLQVIENSVYRAILQVPTFVANGALRGEIGATSSRARDAKIKILFAKHLLSESRNDLNKEIFIKEYENGDNKWIKTLRKYLKEMGLNITEVKNLNKNKIKEKVKIWDTYKWKNEIREKSTLEIYEKYKKDIKEESWVDNTEGSKVLVRARTNSLPLNWRNRFTNKSENCPSCREETETLEHFILDCRNYCSIRNKFVFLQELEDKSKEEKLADILALENVAYDYPEIEIRKRLLRNLWQKRKNNVT